ncbi:MAG: hypothetical protein JSU96_12895 [Acidobacteriota bacterium]|nr:MAG: hypothetical protein JSU96_12895 [Acidobacteriota bacterium]
MKRILLLFVWFGVFGALLAEQLPTKVRVRAVSRDAKILGSGVGGALITIRDVGNGEILARGVQLGGTGDTSRIMVEPRQRGAVVYDSEGAAYFETTLMLEEPTFVEVSAEGPLGYPQALVQTTKTLLLLPGVDVQGEGILLELHGFIVQVLDPGDGDLIGSGQPTKVRARLNMT